MTSGGTEKICNLPLFAKINESRIAYLFKRGRKSIVSLGLQFCSEICHHINVVPVKLT
jgi:hypothetical protein